MSANNHKLQYAGDGSKLSANESMFFLDLKATTAEVISPREFVQNTDLSNYLEEGESLKDLVQSDPDLHFYKFRVNEKNIFVINTMGFDVFFTEDGKPPVFEQKTLHPLSPQLMLARQLAWVLAGENSVFAQHMGKEHTIKIDEETLLIKGDKGNCRLQITLDGTPVCGCEIEGSEIKTIYTHSDCRRKGFATKIIQIAHQLIPNLTYSQSQTDNGKCLFMSVADATTKNGLSGDSNKLKKECGNTRVI